MDQHQKLGLLSDVKKDIQALEKELADLRVDERALERVGSRGGHALPEDVFEIVGIVDKRRPAFVADVLAHV